MTLSAAIAIAALRLLPGLPTDRADELGASIAAASTSTEDAALLLITSRRESGFRREVERCEVLGDGGHAWTGFQLHFFHLPKSKRIEACANPILAAMFALKALTYGKTVRGRIAAYMGRKPWNDEIRLRVRLYNETLKLLREQTENAS